MSTPLLATLFLSLLAPAAAGVSHGLSWATDNSFAPTLGKLPCVQWYYHWADGVVDAMPDDVEFVPMYWGPSGSNGQKWGSVKSYMNSHKPAHLLGFNEPDLSGQANMDPYYAAQEYNDEIVPWGRKGVKIGSPAVAYDVEWLKTFLKELNKKGGYVDFIAMHWYGKHTEIESFKSQVARVHDAAPGFDIWVTEVGLGGDGSYYPSAQQAQDFASAAFGYMDSQPYIKRAAWFGSFQTDNTPDAFGKSANAFFKSGSSQLTSLANWYGYSCSGSSGGESSGNSGNSGNSGSGNSGSGNSGSNNNVNATTKKATKTSSSVAAAKTSKAKKCKRTHGPSDKKKRSRINALLHKKKRNH